jgi:hypothetical protein
VAYAPAVMPLPRVMSLPSLSHLAFPGLSLLTNLHQHMLGGRLSLLAHLALYMLWGLSLLTYLNQHMLGGRLSLLTNLELYMLGGRPSRMHRSCTQHFLVGSLEMCRWRERRNETCASIVLKAL